jgi:predicted permease
MFGNPAVWTLITFTLVAASIAAIALAFELRRSSPQDRDKWDTISAIAFWPAWVLHFATRTNFSRLSRKARLLVVLSIAFLTVGVSSMLLGIFWIARFGNL